MLAALYLEASSKMTAGTPSDSLGRFGFVRCSSASPDVPDPASAGLFGMPWRIDEYSDFELDLFDWVTIAVTMIGWKRWW